MSRRIYEPGSTPGWDIDEVKEAVCLCHSCCVCCSLWFLSWRCRGRGRGGLSESRKERNEDS